MNSEKSLVTKFIKKFAKQFSSSPTDL